jgi:hypothetical protein
MILITLTLKQHIPIPACANLVLEIIQTFGKILDENRAHGFCAE